MRILRYLTGDILLHTLAVSVVLFLVVLNLLPFPEIEGRSPIGLSNSSKVVFWLEVMVSKIVGAAASSAQVFIRSVNFWSGAGRLARDC